MPYYNVDLTMQASIHIEARTEDEAIAIAKNKIGALTGIGRSGYKPTGLWDYTFASEGAIEIEQEDFLGERA